MVVQTLTIHLTQVITALFLLMKMVRRTDLSFARVIVTILIIVVVLFYFHRCHDPVLGAR